MGNVESQNGNNALYDADRGYLSRKHMSRSLRISNKQPRRSRHASSGKIEHRNSETSTRSSSTPSIPQSLTENGLEPFNEMNVLSDFGSPIWVDHVTMNLRPMSFHIDLANPFVHANTMHITLPGPTEEEGHDVCTAEVTFLQKSQDASKDTVSFKKKRSKSADMWRDNSLEFSLSDLSQEHLTSTEEIIDVECEGHLQTSPSDSADRMNSLDLMFSQKNLNREQHQRRYAKWHDGNRSAIEGEDGMMLSQSEEDSNNYGAYTLPCRRSHCLSEGLSSHQAAMCASMQGRRAQTIQDVTTGDASEYEDSGIDGVTMDAGAPVQTLQDHVGLLLCVLGRGHEYVRSQRQRGRGVCAGCV
ncbi:hypothetical protein fugu_010560 [Takifugu bimaculatus]|uniref:Uncharacterized protein n=1 Tax=Takifugu bimaculatus TaxID=433685 RepID=A0A4Z2CAC2_9TELE|nr:hypothetical protein fugu_010560 [Takifugu bimaculatus]